MSIRELRQTKFNTDARGFLRDPNSWTEEFAVSVAPAVGLPDGLTQRHWQVIMFIREVFEQSERCPLLFEVCRANDLKVEELQRLFPSGYLRGVCRLAGHHVPGRISRRPVSDVTWRPMPNGAWRIAPTASTCTDSWWSPRSGTRPSPNAGRKTWAWPAD